MAAIGHLKYVCQKLAKSQIGMAAVVKNKQVWCS